MIIIKSHYEELNHAWIPPQHHRNVADWQGIECTSKDGTSSLYWTAGKSGFFVHFRNVFALMVKWTWEVPSLPLPLCFCHGLAPSPLCRGDAALENCAFSPGSYWGYFSLLPVPSANGCEAMLKVTSKSQPDFKNFTTQLFLFYFLFWSQTISVHPLTVSLHKYLCHIGNKT